MSPADHHRLELDAEDLYENAPCGYLSTTMDGVIVRANRSFRKWSGYGEEELLGGMRLHELLSPGGRIYHETHYAPLLQMQGEAREIAMDFLTSDGRRLPALISAVVRRPDDGDPVVRIAVFDAGDRREYERELLRERRRAEESEARARELAETLQASLIPPTPPSIPGLDVGSVYRPAGSGDEVGGDFYDIFELREQDWAVVIGDVRGKGARAAAVTALVRHTVRAAAMQVREPQAVLRLLNEAMLRGGEETFCTVNFARVGREGPNALGVSMASAGHPLPILVSSNGHAEEVGVPGTLMGVLTEVDLHDHAVPLKPGDVLSFFTDGVTEGRGPDGFFGTERLIELIVGSRSLDAAAIADRIVDELVRFQNGDPRDDIAVVILKCPDGSG